MTCTEIMMVLCEKKGGRNVEVKQKWKGKKKLDDDR